MQCGSYKTLDTVKIMWQRALIPVVSDFAMIDLLKNTWIPTET